MLDQYATIDATRSGFAWDIPAHYNIGVDICDKHATRTPDALALIDVAADASATHYSFKALQDLSNRLANLLTARCVQGDRIAVLLPQCVETAAAHIAISKMGCIALPLFTLFGPEALSHRLADSGARVVITNAKGAAEIAGLRDTLPDLDLVLTIDGTGAADLRALCAEQSTEFTPVKTRADDPAILIYTSGTTGAPKGALHAHRVLLGHLPGVEIAMIFSQNPATGYGPRQIGPGSGVCWMC